ncbi:MAG: hypothetical protein ACFCVE_04200 [Phycisphaerae bacterium]
MIKRKRSLGLAAALLMASASLASADVAQKVPADAVFFIKFNNLQQTSQKFGVYAQDLGAAAFQPALADPMSFLKQQMGVNEGLNEAGEAAFVMLNPADVQDDDGEPTFVILLPVTDYGQFVQGMGGEAGGVSEIQVGQGGEPGFSADWGGGYAAISPTRAAVEAMPEGGINPAGRAAKQLAEQDVVLYANFSAVRDLLGPQMQEAKDEALGDMREHMAEDEQARQFQPVAEAAVNQAFLVVESFLRDATSATIGMNLSDAGIAMTVVADFQEGSYLGNTVASLPAAEKPLLTGIPEGSYLFVGGMAAASDSALKLFDDVAGPVLAEVKDFENAEEIRELAETVRTYIKASEGTAAGMMGPAGRIGQGPAFRIVSVQYGDGPTLYESQKTLQTRPNEIVREMLPPEAREAFAGSSGQTSVVDNVKTIDGVTFNAFVTDFTADEDDPMAMQQEMAIRQIFGDNKVEALVGTTDDVMVTFMGMDDAAIANALQTVKNQTAPLNDQIGLSQTAQSLPEGRFMEYYIALDEIAMTGVQVAQQLGGIPARLRLPPDLPPVGVAASADGEALVIDVFVPKTLLSSMVSGGMQMMMDMQGGGRPGGQGGL